LIEYTINPTNDDPSYAYSMTTPLPELKHPAALPEELQACTSFLLARVGTAIKLSALEAFEDEGLSMYQYSVLAVLAEGARETQATIADTLGLDRGQLVGVLDGLEEAGLIERRRDQSDRRRHMVSLTPAGKKQLVKMRTIVKRIEDAFLEPLDEKSRAVLHRALLRVAAGQDARFECR
jgi:MarR family transcriptional regulator, lower aerobic nicotinate degradation pathway regulator